MTPLRRADPWECLATPASGIAVRRVDDVHPLDLYWARDTHGHVGLALRAGAHAFDGMQWPELTGLAAEWVDAGGATTLVLLLRAESDRDLFVVLCGDLIEATRMAVDAKAGQYIFSVRLSRWQQLLARRRQPGLIEEEARGLWGELHFLLDVLTPAYGLVSAIQNWVSPEDHPQDFLIAHQAVEVKTRLTSPRRLVKISSIEQLDTDESGLDLLVFSVAYANVVEGRSLDEVVENVRTLAMEEAGLVLEAFDAKLLSRGYTVSNDATAAKLVLSKLEWFVVGEGFPRLLKSVAPIGVDQIHYRLDLDRCEVFRRDLPWRLSQ